MGTHETSASSAAAPRGLAFVGITAGSPQPNASTYNAGTMVIENLAGAGGPRITRVTIDLADALVPRLVFDPLGTAGDVNAKPLTIDQGSTATGYVVPDDPTRDPYRGPVGGIDPDALGYHTLVLDFTDLDPGERVAFSGDIDPQSIEGAPAKSGDGHISGLELTGARVTVTFSDGTTRSGSIFADGSAAGGTAIIGARTAPELALSIVGAALAADGSGEVDGARQTLRIEGGAALAGATVRVLVAEAGGSPGGRVTELADFEANKVGGLQIVEVTLDAQGRARAHFTLKGDFPGDYHPYAVNYVTAAVVGPDRDGDGIGDIAGRVADPLALVVDDGAGDAARSFAFDDTTTDHLAIA